jgi:hypothetical protein
MLRRQRMMALTLAEYVIEVWVRWYTVSMQAVR